MPRDIYQLINEQIARSRALTLASASLQKTEVSPAAVNVITISRQYGGCGRKIAQKLADRLGWSLWDRELVDAIARDAVISRKIVEEFDERRITEIDRLARSLTGQYDAGGFIYEHHLARVVLSIAEHGFAIILGRGANFLLPGALNVRLVAAENYRVKVIMNEHNLSREAALNRIHQIDRERAEFIRRTFNRDLNDPTAYDIILNVESFEIDGAVEVIFGALKNIKK